MSNVVLSVPNISHKIILNFFKLQMFRDLFQNCDNFPLNFYKIFKLWPKLPHINHKNFASFNKKCFSEVIFKFSLTAAKFSLKFQKILLKLVRKTSATFSYWKLMPWARVSTLLLLMVMVDRRIYCFQESDPDSRPPPVYFSPPKAPPISAPLVGILTFTMPQSDPLGPIHYNGHIYKPSML